MAALAGVAAARIALVAVTGSAGCAAGNAGTPGASAAIRPIETKPSETRAAVSDLFMGDSGVDEGTEMPEASTQTARQLFGACADAFGPTAAPGCCLASSASGALVQTRQRASERAGELQREGARRGRRDAGPRARRRRLVVERVLDDQARVEALVVLAHAHREV